jgi:hypothetical protein
VTLGAEPKKVAILIALVVAAMVGFYMNSTSDSAPSPRVAVPVAVPAIGTTVPATAPRGRGPASAVNGGEFRPRVIGTRPEDKADPASIDPELRLDLLAKVQAVAPIEAGRNLFQFGSAPPVASLTPIPKDVPKIPVNQHPAPPPPPPVNIISDRLTAAQAPPPINLKYYGYKVSKADGHKEAFLLDGDDIIFAQENQTVKQRYKIVRIALTSITIEDTQANNTQNLSLQDLPL